MSETDQRNRRSESGVNAKIVAAVKALAKKWYDEALEISAPMARKELAKRAKELTETIEGAE